MKFFIAFSIILLLFTSVKTFAINNPGSTLDESFDAFGAKPINLRQLKQAKRDLSLSYAATNINSKEGTRVKTITVIKNHTGKKTDKLAINPELHKNVEWATAFRDNFDSYGSIPDVPDINDLFEFVNKKKPKEETDEGKKLEEPKPKEPPKEIEKPAVEPPAEVAPDAGLGDVQKIKGDAELVPNLKTNNKKQNNVQPSQSLSSAKREPLIDVNYSTPQHSVQQYFDKYIQENPSPKQQQGYDYSKPCVEGTKTSISVTQQSGRTYDIPVGDQNQNAARPYIAPGIAKKTQVQQPQNNSQSFPNTAAAPVNRPNFFVNSILPALQPTPPSQQQQTAPATRNVVNTTAPQPSRPPQTLQQGGGGLGYSTSQRPYLAPNLRNGFGVNRAVPPSAGFQPVYRNDPENFSTNAFGFGFGGNRVNTGRSRGLKY